MKFILCNNHNHQSIKMDSENINIKYHSGIYTLLVKQEIPLELKKTWEFFSTPENLAKITPQHMGFVITSSNSAKMYEGQIISYQIGLFPGIKSKWITEITHVKDFKYFVDEQRFGPYRMWHHEHHFEETKNGVLMTDRVSYKIPGSILGKAAHRIFIKHQLGKIFSYRYKMLDQLFINQ